MTSVAQVSNPAAGSLERRLLFVLGRADDMRAEVYVRLAEGAGDRSECVVTGTLTGPRCSLATTLPATVRLMDLAGSRPPTARGIMTEPAYWTPEMPNLYQLDAKADTGGAEFHCERLVGLRRLGVRGTSLWLDGRRWVPRGIGCEAAMLDMPSLHAASSAAVVSEPSAAVCDAADAAGVAVIAETDRGLDVGVLQDRLLQWSQHPAVVMTVVPLAEAANAPGLRSVLGTMLLAVEVDGSDPPPPPPAGIDCLVVVIASGQSPHPAWRVAAPTLPLMARRKAGAGLPVHRQACDALQADLAAWSCAGSASAPLRDWAGYLVT